MSLKLGVNIIEINWTKTYIMFISNKHKFFFPTHIKINVSICIEHVKKFRLLGITLDCKLNFINLVNDLSLSINKKMYAIKRLFYLSFNVKLQFFKSFILPYFDFGFSIIIYFSKTALNKLNNIYYNCLFKLFKFNFLNLSIFEINNFLSYYNLNSFIHRVLFKLLSFVYNVKHSDSAPLFLKDCLNFVKLNRTYNLRSNGTLVIPNSLCVSKFGECSFKNFFSKFFFNLNDLTDAIHLCDEKEFNNFLNVNIDFILINFVTKFDKFNLKTISYFY